MILRAVLSLLLAIAIATPALAQVRKAELPGVRNYSKVDATVGCAGATDASAETFLAFLRTKYPEWAPERSEAVSS